MKLSTILEHIGIGEHAKCWYISEDASISIEPTQDTNVWIENVDEVKHDKSVIGDFNVNIKVQYPQLSHEILIPYRAVICGFEQITVKKGPLNIFLELDNKDDSDEYFKKTNVHSIFSMEQKYENCPIKSYNLFKNEQKAA